MYTQIKEAGRVTQNKRLIFLLLGNGIANCGKLLGNGIGGLRRGANDKCLGDDQMKTVHAVKSGGYFTNTQNREG